MPKYNGIEFDSVAELIEYQKAIGALTAPASRKTREPKPFAETVKGKRLAEIKAVWNDTIAERVYAFIISAPASSKSAWFRNRSGFHFNHDYRKGKFLTLEEFKSMAHDYLFDNPSSSFDSIYTEFVDASRFSPVTAGLTDRSITSM